MIGDAELFTKMEEAQALIRRDIVFAASLVRLYMARLMTVSIAARP